MMPMKNSNVSLNLINDIFDSFVRGYDVDRYSNHYYDEENKEHVINIQAPGFLKSDIDIDVDGKGIYIKGIIKNEKTKTVIRRNSFNYEMEIYGIDSKSVSATLENGILTITFKTEKEKNSRKVDIK